MRHLIEVLEVLQNDYPFQQQTWIESILSSCHNDMSILYLPHELGKDLAAANHLEHFTEATGDLEECIVLLDKLHHSLELVAMLSQYFNLPRTALGITAR